jgi:hypothetical protein
MVPNTPTPHILSRTVFRRGTHPVPDIQLDSKRCLCYCSLCNSCASTRSEREGGRKL